MRMPVVRERALLKRTVLVSLGLGMLLVAVMLVSLLVGTTDASLWGIVRHVTGGGTTDREWNILINYRLPRALLAALAGGGLASAGAVFQGVLRNPLADPYIIGVAAGGALGAVLSIIVLGEDRLLGTPISAFAGSAIAVTIVYGLAAARRGRSYTETVILAGVIVSALMNALLLLAMSVSSSHELQRIVYWLMGDFSLASFRKVSIAAAFVIAGWIVLYLHANTLNVLIAGDETARALGLNIPLTRTLLTAIGALLTGVIVSVSGTIGFVGLVVPHAMRLLFGPDNRILLPASLLGGAVFLAAADTIARNVAYPSELPVGVITALTGAPFFLYLLVRR